MHTANNSDMNPSPRVWASRSESQHSGQGVCQRITGKSQSCGSHGLERIRSQSSGAEPLVADGQGRSVWQGRSALPRGAELSLRWPGACLNYTLEDCVLQPSGSLDKCLGTLDGEWRNSPGAYLCVVSISRHSCSGHVCQYFRCVSLPSVSGMT